MKGIMYGAGNIGRGFIGPLLALSGWDVTFIDIAEEIIKPLHEKGCYPVRIVSMEGYKDIGITNVDGIMGNDENAVVNAIANGDIMATAVGANVLIHIVPNIVKGLRQRWKSTEKPLNILICENLMDASKAFAGMIKDELNKEELALFENRVGLIETSIGRMVPIQTKAMQDGNPLRVCVEEYGFLPVDKDGFKGEIPNIKGMIPFSPFDYYKKRKLYLHNMSHAVCAYLGCYTGAKYIHQAIDDPQIYIIVKEAMYESMAALSEEYSIPMQEIINHGNDLIIRFTNTALMDTCERVGNDPIRKLNVSDRLIGAIRLCEKRGIQPLYISIGVAGALFRYLNENGGQQSIEKAAALLWDTAGINKKEKLFEIIIGFYGLLCKGQSPEMLRKEAQKIKKDTSAGVV